MPFKGGRKIPPLPPQAGGGGQESTPVILAINAETGAIEWQEVTGNEAGGAVLEPGVQHLDVLVWDNTISAWVPAQLEGGTVSPHDVVAPEAPTGLTGTVQANGVVVLDWDASVSGETAGYRVYQNGSPIEDTDDAVTTHTVTGLTNGQSYTFAVRAFDASNNVSFAVTVTVVASNLAPGTPTGLQATAGVNQVTLDWPDHGEADIDFYKVYRDGVHIASPELSTLVNTSLTAGQSYSYQISAVDLAGQESDLSTAVQATPTAPAIAAPTGLTATPGNGSVALSWNAVSGAVSYVVRKNGAIHQTGITGTSVTVTGLPNGTPVTFTVSAIGSQSQASVPSAEATATPVLPPQWTKHVPVAAAVSATTYAGSPALIYDGDENTMWESSEGLTTGAWVRVDLGSSKSFKRVRVRFKSPTGRFGMAGGGCFIFTADVIGTWTNRGNFPADGEVVDIEFAAPITARYVLMENGGVASGNWWGVREFEVFTPA